MGFEIGKENWIPTRTLAKLTGLSPERIRQLTDDGIFICRQEGNRKLFDLAPSVQTYIEYLKNQNRSVGDMDDEARKIKADADWKEAKAEIEQMKRDELRAVLHSSEDVLEVTNDLVMTVRSALLALPGTLAVDCADAETAAQAAGIIKAAVNDVLNSLADYQYDPAKYKKLVRERETWMRAEENEENADN